MFKILFVYPNSVMLNPPPVSLACFYAILRKNKDLEIRLFDTTFYNTEARTSDKAKEENLQVRPFDFAERDIRLKTTDVFEDFKNMVADYKPDLIAISCNEITYPLGLALLQAIPGDKAFKLMGGVFATFAPEEALASGHIDAVCIGEGEDALTEVVETLSRGQDIHGIRNLCFKKGGQIVKNPLRALVDINETPIPDYDLFEEARYYRPMAGKVWRLFPIETSRGCPYNCSFCNSPSQRRLYAGQGINNFFRKKSIERLDQEIADVVQKYRAEYIYFLSDTLLSFNHDEFDRFCKMYAKYALPFWCQNRPELITLDRARRLKDINCQRMSIGIEHGNEEFRRTVLKKPSKNAAIVEACEILDKVGIPITVNNIIGFPLETRELAFDTIRLNRQLKFDTSNGNAFMPFHGTELYDLCVKNGFLVPGAACQCVTKGTILNMPQFPPRDIDGLVKTFALYAKLPEEHFPRIKDAEKDDAGGKKAFKDLGDLYKKLYF